MKKIAIASIIMLSLASYARGEDSTTKLAIIYGIPPSADAYFTHRVLQIPGTYEANSPIKGQIPRFGAALAVGLAGAYADRQLVRHGCNPWPLRIVFWGVNGYFVVHNIKLMHEMRRR